MILLNGWPGDRRDYDALVRLLVNEADVIVPDLRGFGESDKYQADAEEIYSGRCQANGVIALLEELAIKGAVIGGYDVGSFVAQTVARIRPDLVRALVVSPPLPGAGKRVLELKEAKEFWCATFHQLTLAAELVDGKPEAVRAYLRHFWEHWSGPTYVVDESRLDHLAEMYSKPGAFTASMMWYRASGNPVTAYAQEEPPERSNGLPRQPQSYGRNTIRFSLFGGQIACTIFLSITSLNAYRHRAPKAASPFRPVPGGTPSRASFS